MGVEKKKDVFNGKPWFQELLLNFIQEQNHLLEDDRWCPEDMQYVFILSGGPSGVQNRRTKTWCSVHCVICKKNIFVVVVETFFKNKTFPSTTPFQT